MEGRWRSKLSIWFYDKVLGAMRTGHFYAPKFHAEADPSTLPTLVPRLLACSEKQKIRALRVLTKIAGEE
jgi:hypothetical protein